MGDGADRVDETGRALGGQPDADHVRRRADGRPPEEESSEDPAGQAEAILQESEDRTAGGADAADGEEADRE
jgi:hypothetical protein